MLSRPARRLPGFRFEVQPPPLPQVLPRMDVAVFVGFAAAGPLHLPVVVEDAAQFAAIFGEDTPLAWDVQRGAQIYSYLGPAIRGFFRNGGKRCWVVRVAGEAQVNYFPVPGLLQARLDEAGQVEEVGPALAQARAKGSWSDALRIGTALLSRPLEVLPTSFTGRSLDLSLLSLSDLSEGDLLRLNFREAGYQVMFPVAGVQPIDNPTFSPLLSDRVTRRAVSASPLWFKTRPLPAPGTVHAKVVTDTGESEPLTVQDWQVSEDGQNIRLKIDRPTTAELSSGITLRLDFDTPRLELVADEVIEASPLDESVQLVGSSLLWRLPWPEQALIFTGVSKSRPVMVLAQPVFEGETVRVTLGLAPADLPAPGSSLCLDYGEEQLWLVVQDLNIEGETLSPLAEAVQVSGPGLWWLKNPPVALPASLPTAQKLSFELWVRQGDANPVQLSDLGFQTGHSRFWGALPTDEELFREPTVKSDTPYLPLWQGVTSPRFPLAGYAEPGAVYFPLAMPVIPDQFLGPLPPSDKTLAETRLERDGLTEFSHNLFLDPELSNIGVADLIAEADYLRYESTSPRSLKGIYAALSVEEATLIAVPDAVHRAWQPLEPEEAPSAQPVKPVFRPEWFGECYEAIKDQEPLPKLSWSKFLKCGLREIAVPSLLINEPPDPSGTFTLLWSGGTEPNTNYILEEATRADFKDAVTIYSGKANHLKIYGRRPGNYYYQVRQLSGEDTSNWSIGVIVPVAQTRRWRANPITDYSEAPLLALHRALLRLCAARGDLLAVLALPEHYREDALVNYLARLKQYRGEEKDKTLPLSGPLLLPVDPLGRAEGQALSYGAVYHPWLTGLEELDRPDIGLQSAPPDGAACGIIASRALGRGAWIAPANEALSGVVALTPPISRGQWLRLQEAQLNLIRQEPGGFLALNADTLSNDSQLRQINVRRLLILLRRLALRLGADYVFEMNSPSFRRLVQRSFEAMLEEMLTRGAFAGDTAATSFQVAVDTSPQNQEQGRFIVELRVAPSLPLTFLTVRLVQSGERGTVTEVS